MIDKRCEEWLRKFDELWATGAHYTALTYLGSIFDALSLLPETSRPRWIGVIKRSRPATEIVDAVRDTAHHNLQYLNRVLDYGGEYLDEEILLVLNARNEMESIKKLLEDAYDIDFTLPLCETDAMIKKRFARAKMSRASRKLYHKLYLERRKSQKLPRLL